MRVRELLTGHIRIMQRRSAELYRAMEEGRAGGCDDDTMLRIQERLARDHICIAEQRDWLHDQAFMMQWQTNLDRARRQ